MNEKKKKTKEKTPGNIVMTSEMELTVTLVFFTHYGSIQVFSISIEENS